MKNLIFATRPSALARWQTQAVIQALQACISGLNCIEHVITTRGDRILNQPLPEIGGKGLFTDELEAALLNGQVDCAVHSLKYLTVISSPDLSIGCIPTRGEVRDVLVSARRFSLQTLPAGAVVGTSSLRRAAQLLHARPDLVITSLRGNVDTRLRKALEGPYDAIVLAGAGLVRLGLDRHITEWLPLEVMLPAPGQGALAVQCRKDDPETLAILSNLEDPSTRLEVGAERTFLQELGGGCSMPVAAYAVSRQEAKADEMEISASAAKSAVTLTGLVASPDGRQVIRMRCSGNDAQALAVRLARQAIREGAGEILNLVNNKDTIQ